MSVMCRVLGSNHMTVYTKGAPEKVVGMCLKESVPEDFRNNLEGYAARGYRVIALAYKPLPARLKLLDVERKIKRDAIEKDLIFAGLLVMRNGLKPETAPVIRCLHSANIRTVMITGDNIYTAISVARSCDMVGKNDRVVLLKIEAVDTAEIVPKLYVENIGMSNEPDQIAVPIESDSIHFAVDGKTWHKLRVHYPHYVDKLLVRTTIFARFQPDQKTQLISSLQKLDYVVSMVGDGANDCGVNYHMFLFECFLNGIFFVGTEGSTCRSIAFRGRSECRSPFYIIRAEYFLRRELDVRRTVRFSYEFCCLQVYGIV